MAFFRRKTGAFRSHRPDEDRIDDARPSSARRRTSRNRRLTGLERLEDRSLLTGVPFGAIANDTAEYLLGDVYVSVVFMESNGTIDNNRENWTPQLTSSVKQKIEEGVTWWKDTLANEFPNSQMPLNFHFDYTYADTPVQTGYEPITRPSDDFSLWIYDFFNQAGYNRTGDFSLDSKAFNHAQRSAHNTSWAFTIFVVNDTNDPDHQFNSSGTFDRSFAYSGGRFEVVLASRPASTYAHETGHIFWTKDEYFGGSAWTDRRGYYNTQNTNAADNTTPGFQQQPSIMTSGAILDQAYTSHTSPASTLELVGWKDSDGDGIFDVLDVPLTLSGTGYLDTATGNYRFVGKSSVQTLPNLNSDSTSLKNDITINQVGRAEYRIDNGAWVTAQTYNAYTANLDLTIESIPAGSHSIDIRTIDPTTGVMSQEFHGTTDRPTAVNIPGINGFVWNDLDADGVFDANERGIADQTMRLVDANNQPINLQKPLEPDDYASGTNLGSVIPEVSLSAVGGSAFSQTVSARTSTITSTGAKIFSNNNSQDSWTALRQLKMVFASPMTTLSIDAVGNGPGVDYGRLDAYDAANNLIARYTTQNLGSGQKETMRVSRPTADIAYAIAYGHLTSGVLLDNLKMGPSTTVTTDSTGSYHFASLPADTCQVQAVPAAGWNGTNPTSNIQTVTLASGDVAGQVDFGQAVSAAPWQNPNNRLDVNNDGSVSAIDVLQIINDINNSGSRLLPTPPVAPFVPPPYLDVNADGFVSPIDALTVIEAINNGAGGEGAASFAVVSGIVSSNGQSSPTSAASVPSGNSNAVNNNAVGEGEASITNTASTSNSDSQNVARRHHHLAAVDQFFASWDSGTQIPVSSSSRRRNRTDLHR